MEFGILGPLEVRDDSGPVLVPGVKERAVLAVLLVNAGRVVAVDRLVEDVWGDDPPANPANALQGRVSGLRRALGPGGSVVVTSPPGYRLAVAPEQVDAGRFEGLAAQAEALASAEPARASGLLEAALALWRGAALVEFAERPWALVEAARLEELRLGAVAGLVELRLAGGGHAGVVGELEGLVAAFPVRERLRGLLMVALYRSGRQAEALGVFQAGRVVLAEELGIDPSPELQRLHQQILVQDPALDAPGGPPAAPPHNLPGRLTSFVGRDQELRQLAKLVELHRLVTVTGPGGVGKTSVAVELGRRVAGGYPDGVWLVELAAVGDPGPLVEAVAAAIGLDTEPGEAGGQRPSPLDRLAEFAADKALLLVLDNCEHLVGACAELVQGLLRAGPRVRVLATSREVLGVPGEAVWPVPPLAVPGPGTEVPVGGGAAGTAPEVLGGYDAVRLFVERAATADPGFTLSPANAVVVADICARLDGLPLAIELAAARVRALPPAEIAARLDDRFAVLAGGGRTVDPRQRTLRAAIDWSWELLEDPDRRLLGRLSVFSGGWTVAAAEAVCGGRGVDPAAILEGVVRLVDRSLVVAAGGEPARFQLLESLRVYAAQRLAEAGETGLVEARHTGWFLDLAEQSQHGFDEPWLLRVAADYDNLRAVFDRAVAAPDPDTALRLAGALGWYWANDRHDEGRRRVEAALAIAPEGVASPELARALQSLAIVDVVLGPRPATLDAARRSLELFEGYGDRRAVAMSKLLCGQAELQLLGRGDAARLLAEAEATFGELGDRWGEAYARSGRFAAGAFFGEPTRAYALAEQALEGFREVGDRRGAAYLQFVLGMAARFQGRLEEAGDRYQEALAAAREAGPTWVACSSLIELGSLAALRGEDDRADAMHAEAAALARRTGMRRGIAHVHNEMGMAARARGQPERALPLHQVALGIHRSLVPTRVARTLGQVGCTEARLGRLDEAEAHLREAAALALATPQPPTVPLLLNGFALVAAGRGDHALAARLLGAAGAARERFGVPAVGAEREEAALAGRMAGAGLTPDAYEAALAAGRELPPDQALRVALG